MQGRDHFPHPAFLFYVHQIKSVDKADILIIMA